jgi:DNA repair photolyase
VRWRLAEDGDAQGALFEEEVERHIGRGEFRGMEFLHVNARTIINEIPAASQLPFRWTINAYRGCSHACKYCVAGDTPVLMADGRTRRIADIRVGDEIYGTVFDGKYRRYARTSVLAHWSTTKPAWRVELEDGTVLVASGDHRFLSDRGWKHVYGYEWTGPLQRPHLTHSNKLIGTGQFAEQPKHTDEYRRGYLCGMIRGDANLSGFGDRPRFRLALTDVEALDRSERFLADAGIPTTRFLFQAATPVRRELLAIRAQSIRSVDAIRTLVAWPRDPSDDWSAGFLAGVFDAEGHHSSKGIFRISNGNAVLLHQIATALERFGLPFVIETPRDHVPNVRLIGGLPQRLRFLLLTDPAITRKRSINGVALKNKGNLRIKRIDPLHIEMPMYDITTGTGDFIANGVVSHNCFARPTHEYLDMNAGEDFEKKIVVKINAVERLKAELNPARWAGEHIAMGTNTDPYQRCEGKYHLTRGIIEQLAEHGNPFSILTKSTLILRDLDVLTAAAQRADVRANFSIGTLDEEVWRMSEPGTPHPKQRVEAVRKLNEAGIPTGVLVAPVLPGLSDRPDQLEAVVKACVDAGATTVSPIVLHLRPGVREQYVPWLERERPDLVPLYEKLYPRSYAAKSEQQKVTRAVYRYVRQFGGLAVQPGSTRDTGHEKAKAKTTPKKRAKPPPQLDLKL